MENVLPPILTQLKLLVLNPVLLAAVTSCASAQLIKTAINLFSGKIHSVKELFATLIWSTGGMPSSHSAMTTSLCITIGFKNGFNSNIFIVALMFLFVVIRDSFGVRRSSGIQAKKLNELGEELKEKGVIEEYNKLKEVNGHTPMEVMCGVILGILIALSYSLLN